MSRREQNERRRDAIEKTARDVSRSTGMSRDAARQRVADAVAKGDRKRNDNR